MTYDIVQIQEKLRKKQSDGRFLHTLGVSYTSACLAMKYGSDMTQAQVAGLLHDCAKHMKAEKLLKYCKENHLEVTKAQYRQPYLLHGKVGAYLAKEKYGVEDEQILSAIEWHTTGKPAMSLLEKIVFVADYIEPHRNKAPNLEELRSISFENIDKAVYLITKQTLDYLEDGEGAIDEASVRTFDFYKELFVQE